MNEGPRTWKWLIPGLIAVAFVFWGMQWAMATGSDISLVGTFMVIVGVFFGVAAAVNLWRLVSEHAADLHQMRKAADATTPLVLLSKNMRQMHPEAIKVLNRFGVKTSWGVTVDIERGERDWILLDTDPSVHFGFVEHVLTNSKGTLMPMGWFSEGSKKWDPDGLVEDREQYTAFRKWLYARMMITEAHGNQPPHFIPPWNGALILEAMGLTGEQELYKPDLSEGRKDLSDIPQVNGFVTRKRTEAPKEAEASKEPEVTEEEWEAIQAEMKRNAAKYAS